MIEAVFHHADVAEAAPRVALGVVWSEPGGAATHGLMFHRAPGSIGASAFPSRVMKGNRSSGRLGGKRSTAKNLLVVRVDLEKNLIYLRGPVPGARRSLVKIVRATPAKAE